MIRNYIVLSIAIVASFFPILAYAQSPVVDTLDSGVGNWASYTSGWSSMSWDTNAADCYSVFCGSETGFNQQFSNIAYSLPENSGSFVVYFRNDGYTGTLAIGVCTTDDSSACKDPTEIGGPDSLLTDQLDVENDNTWHFEYFAFRDGASDKEWCAMIDDDDPSDCGWTSSTVPNGTNYGGIVLLTANGMNSGASFFWDEIGNSQVPPLNSETDTRIQAVVPSSGTTIPTSSTTTIGAIGYVNPSDFTTGMSLTIRYNTNVGLCNSNLPFLPCTASTISFPITASGPFSFSTTSPTVDTGQYTMQTNIVGAQNANIFGFQINLPFLSSTKTSTSTTFIVDSLSGYDQYQASTTDSIDGFLGTTTVDLSSCSSLTSFNLQNCLSTLFLPQGTVLLAIYTVFQNNFLLDFPWGYATRFVQILSSSATSSIPSASVSIWTPYSDGTEDASTTLTIDPTATLAAASAAMNVDANGTDLNWQGVLEPYVDLFIAISLLFIIIGDLMGVYHKGGFVKRKGGGLS